jgi:sugar-specific transcriptional regulator TrmB
MNDDLHQPRQIDVLRELGLSRTEAEVYVACLSLGQVGALSSYRVAQEMGRDPANVGKVVNALVHWQAVRVVQEKPRLFVAVPPDAFASHLVERLRKHGAEAVTLLESFATPAADGVAQALTSPGQALDRARDLLVGCHTSAVVMGSPETLHQLGADLEDVAGRPGCRVRVLSPEALASAVVDIGHLPVTGHVGTVEGDQWLHLVVDDSAWLTAVLGPAAMTGGPCGWWCYNSTIGRVLGEILETCWRSAVPLPAAAPAPVSEYDVVIAPQEEPVSTATPAPATRTGIHPAFSGVEQVRTSPQEASPPPPATPTPPAQAAAAPEPPLQAPSKPTPPQQELWSSPLSSEEADRAGFSFLFRHPGKSKKGGDK